MNLLIPHIAYQFLLSLSMGTALFSWIADPALTGAGFIRLVVGHGAIFLLLATIVQQSYMMASDLALQMILFTVLIIQWRFHPDKRRAWTWVLYVVQASLTLALFYQFDPSFYFATSSALFLGITHYAMLLGHYYLVVPKLTEKPLLVCLKIFWFLMAMKLGMSGWALWEASEFLVEGSLLGDGFMFNWIVVSMRFLWGYGALMILSYFAWRLCRMRSIQSATGVLYIMVFFVFVGELLSSYFYLKHGIKL
jgi:hypothetical protein